MGNPQLGVFAVYRVGFLVVAPLVGMRKTFQLFEAGRGDAREIGSTGAKGLC